MKGFIGVTDNEAGMAQGAGLRAQGNWIALGKPATHSAGKLL